MFIKPTHCFFLIQSLFIAHQILTFTPAQHTQICCNNIPKDYKLFDGSKVTLSSQNTLDNLQNKWQQILDRGFEKLFNQVNQDVTFSPEEIYSQLNNEEFAQAYVNSMHQEMLSRATTYIEEEDMDPQILGFIKTMVQKYTQQQNIKIVLTDAFSTVTATFGSDIAGFYLCCNPALYTEKNIKNYYSTFAAPHTIFYFEYNKSKLFRWISMPNLLQLGIMQAVSNIKHQTNFVYFTLLACHYNKKGISHETKLLCSRLHEFLTLFETIVQSTNPLESALFLQNNTQRNQKEKKTWQQFLTDIEHMYDPISRQEFNQQSEIIKQHIEQ